MPCIPVTVLLNMIETPRLFLREASFEDFASLHRIVSDPITMKFWASPFCESDTKNWLDRSLKAQSEYGLGHWAILLRESGKQIGDAGLMHTLVNGKPETDLGCIIHWPQWRKGFGFEAASALMQFGIKQGECRIVANMAHDHIASQRLVERLGMVKEHEFTNSRNRNILTYLYVYQESGRYSKDGSDVRASPKTDIA